MRILHRLFITTSFLGQAVSFHKVYAAHFFAIPFLFLKLAKDRFQFFNLQKNYYAAYMLFIAWTLVTLSWNHESVSLKYGVIYLLGFLQYISCSGTNKEEREKLLLLLGFLALLDVCTGLLESTTTLRFPNSGLNPNVAELGKAPTYDFKILSEYQLSYHETSPTGFRWGMNNFVFGLFIYLLFAMGRIRETFYIILLAIVSYLTVSASARVLFWTCFPLLATYSFLKKDWKMTIGHLIVPGLVALLMMFGSSIMSIKAEECLTLPSVLIKKLNEQKQVPAIRNEVKEMILASPTTSSEIKRIAYLKNNVARIKQNPILGTGLGKGSVDLMTGNHQSPHMYLIEVLTDTGLIGFLIYLVFLIKPVIDSFRISKEKFYFTIFVTGFVLVGSVVLSSLVYFPIYYLALGFVHSDIHDSKAALL